MFKLTNDRPRIARPLPCAAPERTKQKMLLSGLDCLPGQLDLFEVDALPKETADDDLQVRQLRRRD